MKTWMHRILISLFLLSLAACGGATGESYHDTIVGDPGIQGDGSVQKGPFITGSSITVQGLNKTLEPNGKTYQLVTENDVGAYRFNAEMGDGLFQFIAQGFYFNEVLGELSSAPLTLRATVDLVQDSRANINMLTSLTERRIVFLVKNQGMDFASAKVKAEQEILKLFNIATLQTAGFELLDISQTGNENAILLGISAAMQGDLTVAQLSERLAKLSFDLEDGTLDDLTKIDELIASEEGLNLEAIRANLEARYQQLGFAAEIPPFEMHAQRLVPLEVKELKAMTLWSSFPQTQKEGGALTFNLKTPPLCPTQAPPAPPPPPAPETVDPAKTTWTAVLRKRLDPSSVNGNTIQLKSGNESIPLLFDYQVGSFTLGIRPQAPLDAEKTYTLSIAGLVAFDGTPQVAPFSQEIKTPVIAKPAANFDILASEFLLTFDLGVQLSNPKAEDFSLSDGQNNIPLNLVYDAAKKQIRLTAQQSLADNTLYKLRIESLAAYQDSMLVPHYSWDIQIPKADFTTQLRAYYKLDNGSAKDSSPNQLDASVNNQVQQWKDRFGQPNKAMHVSAGWQQTPEIKIPKSVFNHQQPWTYSFWVAAGGGSSIQSVFSLISNDNLLTPVLQLQWPFKPYGNATEYCSNYYLGDTPSDQMGDLLGTTYFHNQSGYWYHVVFVYHGASSFSLYVNGTAVASNRPMNWWVTSYADTNYYAIGGVVFPWNSLSLNSIFDDLRFYQGVLTPYDIKKLYEAEKGP